MEDVITAIPEIPASPFCPSSFSDRCSRNVNDSSLVSFDIGRLPTYISIVSCSFSCFGSLLILLAYFAVKGIRNTAQKIITLLAIADFFTAFGYLMAAWNFLTHYNVRNLKRCRDVFQTVCAIQSFVTTWSSMSSFWWTCALGLHFYFVLSPTKRTWPAKLLPWENIIAWIFPLVIVFPMLATGKLGYAPYATSNWCFIKDENYSYDLKDRTAVIVYILIAGKLWEIFSYMFVVVMYTLTARKFHKQLYLKLHAQPSGYAEDIRSEVKQRLLLIPLMFLLLRIWGTVQFFFSLGVSDQNHNGCIPRVIHNVFYALGIFQAVGDGGQGWGNALLYIFLSPTIRTQLLCDPIKKLYGLLLNKYCSVLGSSTRSTSPTHSIQVNRQSKLTSEPTDLKDI